MSRCTNESAAQVYEGARGAGVRRSPPRSCTKESVSQVCEGVRCVGVRRSPLRRCAKESASQVYEGVRFARRDALPSASACTQK